MVDLLTALGDTGASDVKENIVMSTASQRRGCLEDMQAAGGQEKPKPHGRAPWPILLLAALALAGALALNMGVAQARQARPAASTISILSETQTFRYPSTMTFTLQANDSSGSISSAHLIIEVPPEQIHHDVTVPVNQPGSQITLNYAYDATNDYLPPFTPITYHWVLGDSNQQNTLTGASKQFDFEDTRFTWSHLSQSNITVYWYKLNSTFGQQLLSTAVSEATSIEQDLQGTLTTPIRVFAYQSSEDLREGLPPSAPDWAGGVALVELYQALIVVGNSEAQPLQRDLPHELTHLILHEVAGLDCGGCPLWFDEGMAVYHQIYHEPDMQALFDQTVRNNRLLLFNTLTQRFPSDSTLAELAYAQSWNFLKYLYQQFGEPKIARLVNSLPKTDFDKAFSTTFGNDVAHLESQWHVSLRLPPTLDNSPNATAGTEGGNQNPAPVSTPGNSDQLLAVVVLLATLVLMGMLGGGYLWWRRRQAPALVPGGAPMPYGPAPQAPGLAPPMAPPSGIQPGPQNIWPQGGVAPGAPGIQPAAPERLIQTRQEIVALMTSEKRLEAQQAQLQSQLARCAEQERGALAAQRSDLLALAQRQRQQLEGQLASLQQQLSQVRLQKQQQLQMERQLAASSQTSGWPGANAPVGTGFTGAGWAAPGRPQDGPRRQIPQE